MTPRARNLLLNIASITTLGTIWAGLVSGWLSYVLLAILFCLGAGEVWRQKGFAEMVFSSLTIGLIIAVIWAGIYTHNHGVLMYYLIPYATIGAVYVLGVRSWYRYFNPRRGKKRIMVYKLLDLVVQIAVWVPDLPIEYRRRRNTRTASAE